MKHCFYYLKDTHCYMLIVLIKLLHQSHIMELFFPHHLEFWSFLMCFGALKSLHEINYVTLSLSTFKYSI